MTTTQFVRIMKVPYLSIRDFTCRLMHGTVNGLCWKVNACIQKKAFLVRNVYSQANLQASEGRAQNLFSQTVSKSS